MQKMKWGIIGCGGIAGDFTESLRTLEGAELFAVASRTPGKAADFAKKHKVDLSYDTYEALLANPSVEIVYVATTHNFHYDNVLQCLKAGKHVLCEKVFTINAAQAQHLWDVAQEKGLFLMEAMWTRFLPATKELMKIIEQGTIGEVMFLKADFSFKTKKDLTGRFYNLKLAGGSMMDQGIYPISYASMVFGQQPKGIMATSAMSETGIDERSTELFDYGHGKCAELTTSIAYYNRRFLLIAGTKGSIEVNNFFSATTFDVIVDGETTTYDYPYVATGKGYEAQEVMDCILAGKKQSSIMPMDETVAIMATIDDIRQQIGLTYTDDMEQIKA